VKCILDATGVEYEEPFGVEYEELFGVVIRCR
jgi:hypothetical protein